MTGLTSAALAGAGAGIGVALPLGAIGVLLFQEAMVSGRRTAAGGALGIALVDLGYAALALLAGAGLTRALHGHERAVQLAGAVILVAVAARGLLRLHRAPQPQPQPQPQLPGLAVIPPVGHRPGPGGSPWPVTGRFVALTAINPLTAVYFVALAAGSPAAISGAGRSAAFAAGVFAASLSWQLVLVAIGAGAGHRLGERARRATGAFGYLIVLGYAARLAAGAG